MKEQIILAPGLNGKELIKSLAMHGVSCINLRICSAGELARMALMRSGVQITEAFISSSEADALIAEAIKGEKYFDRATYSDIQQIAGAIRRMRSLAASDDEEAEITRIMGQGVFTEKNAALVSVYKKYMKLLSDAGAIDHISLIRKAISESEAMKADFITIDEYPLAPVETALLDKLSGGTVARRSIYDLYGITDRTLKIENYWNCYGAPNEVETILTDIYADRILDQCTVAVTDVTTYAQLFFDYALLHDIPITFGCGIPIMNSDPAKLLVAYYHWMTDGFYSVSALRAMLSSEAFNRDELFKQFPENDGFRWKKLLEMIGGIRLTENRAINDQRLNEYKSVNMTEEKKLYLPYIEIMARELSLPPEEFIYRYAHIRKYEESNSGRLLMMLDRTAADAIYDELKIIRNSGVEQSPEDIILNVLGMNVCKQRSEEGKLYITGMESALSAIRENVYIAGLSASKYPGSPRENYLLLDEDLNLFGPGADHMTSSGRIEMKKSRLMTLARLASSLGSAVMVSYSGLNVSELKKDNASSLIYELYNEESDGMATSEELDKHIVKVEYFEPKISVTRKIGDAYNSNLKVCPCSDTEVREAIRNSITPDKSYSATALGSFFNCPRSFLLSYILGIPQPDDDDPFRVISAAASGSLAHSLMEKLGNSSMTKDEFLKISGEAFDDYLSEHPPVIPDNAPAARDDFLDMMDTAYEMDPHREVVLEEEDIECVHESGVKIHGFPDRVEKLEDGTYLVVDFKTGRKVSHMENSILSCLQVVVYAYLMEQRGFQVSNCEFRYIRLGEIVPCRYDKEMKAEFDERMNSFKCYMEKGDFELPQGAEFGGIDGSDPCRYCKYDSICGKYDEGGTWVL